MKKYLNILMLLLMLGAVSCSKENPFEVPQTEEGKLLTRDLKIEINNEINLVRAVGVPDVNEFTVAFFKEGQTEAEAYWKYSQLPEIVTLPVGSYVARASYGDNAPAAWDAPYFKGETTFEIIADEITDKVEPIVCRLSNVKVTILFDEELQKAMSAGSKVNVKCGDEGSLDFTVADQERSGFFAYVENSHTLVAEFDGQVEGFDTREIKTYDNVAPGNHYRITFRLRSASSSDPGDIDSDLRVDASVEVVDVNGDVNPDDDVLVDDMRPSEGGDDPTPPGPIVEDAPEIYCIDADGNKTDAVKLDVVNNYNEDTPYCLMVTSKADGGITGFVVDIQSPAAALSPEELRSMGLDGTLDLINAESLGLAQGLTDLSLPYGDEVKGKKSVVFDITGFMPLLSAVGGGETHTFKLTVTDANGTTVKKLIVAMP